MNTSPDMNNSASESSAERPDGLLDRIAETALDDDYYVVRAGQPEPSRSFNTTLTGSVLGVFALMVTITAMQTASNRPATQREQQALAQDVSVRRAISTERRDKVTSLRAEVRDLSAASGQENPDAQALRATTAATAVRGPGIRVRIVPAADDGGRGDVSDSDLQVLVNALWYVGAEAISVNDQRVGTLTSIRTAGAAITVNYVSIDPPYTVRAIGDAENLSDRLSDSRLGRDWTARAAETGLSFDISSVATQRLAAISEKRRQIVHAETARDNA